MYYAHTVYISWPPPNLVCAVAYSRSLVTSCDNFIKLEMGFDGTSISRGYTEPHLLTMM